MLHRRGNFWQTADFFQRILNLGRTRFQSPVGCGDTGLWQGWSVKRRVCNVVLALAGEAPVGDWKRVYGSTLLRLQHFQGMHRVPASSHDAATQHLFYVKGCCLPPRCMPARCGLRQCLCFKRRRMPLRMPRQHPSQQQASMSAADQLTRPSSRLGAESPSLPNEPLQRRPRPCSSPALKNHTPTNTPAVPICSTRTHPPPTHVSEAAEIKRILQGMMSSSDLAPSDSPRKTFLGVSPPTRSMGVANPLVQDALWQRDPYRATHCNLQALREIDAHGISFLRADNRGDWRLLIGSPESAFLAEAAAEESSEGEQLQAAATPSSVARRARERTSPSSCSTAAAFL